MASGHPTPKSMMDIKIVPASPEQELEANRREGQQWHNSLLSAEQYVQREQHLESSEFSRKRKQKWVMVEADDTGSLDFLASCETHRRPILLLKPGATAPVRTIAYSICSVLVPPSKRKRGYASLMMTLLHQQLSSEGRVPFPALGTSVTGSDGLTRSLDDPTELDDGTYGRDATASFLYSDVGDFYEPYGWTVLGAQHVEWDVPAPAPAPAPDAPPPIPAEWLSPAELGQIAQLDHELLLATFAAAAAGPSDAASPLRFAIDDPHATAWRWRIERDNYAHQHGRDGAAALPTRYGVVLRPDGSDGAAGRPSYAAWTYDHAGRQLNVLRLRFETRSALAALVGLLRGEAARHGMERVEAWNVDLARVGVEVDAAMQQRLWRGERVDAFRAELAGGDVVERSGTHLPSVAWYGSRRAGQKVEWLHNEYGWYL